jgi:hypothetical protein
MTSLNLLKKNIESLHRVLNVDIEPFTLVIDSKTVSLAEGVQKLIDISRSNP